MSEAEQNQQPLSWPGIAGRGVLMGLAEVVPGVSGGTMAFVTGIYPRLVSAIASFGPASLAMLFNWRRFVAHHDLFFLLSLAGGMAMGILAFAQVMSWLLLSYRPVVWGFFSGVILMSVWVIGSERNFQVLKIWSGPGFVAGLALLALPVVETAPTILYLLAGSAVAVCAWLLPAVSGSYVLLTLGLYGTVINAVSELDLFVLGVVAAGCAAGLLLFARALARAMERFPEQVLSVLTGFMLGSVIKLWPWQLEGVSGWAALTSPDGYVANTQGSGHVLAVVLAAVCGAIGLWVLARLTRN